MTGHSAKIDVSLAKRDTAGVLGVDVVLSTQPNRQGRISKVIEAMLAIISDADSSLQPQNIHVLPNWKTPVNYLENNYPVVTLRVGNVDMTEMIYGRAMFGKTNQRGHFVTYAFTAHVWGEKTWQLFEDVNHEDEAVPQVRNASDVADNIIDALENFTGDSTSGIVFFDRILARESEPERGPQRLTRVIISGFVMVQRPLSPNLHDELITSTRLFSLDTLLSSRLQKPFGLDTLFLTKLQQPFSLDTLLAMKLQQPFSLDTLLVAKPQQQFSLDALFSTKLQQQFSLDTLFAVILQQTFSLDTLLANKLQQTFSLDALLGKQIQQTFSLDTLLANRLQRPFNLDTLLEQLAITPTFSLDALLEQLAITPSFGLDVLLSPPAFYGLDSLLSKQMIAQNVSTLLHLPMDEGIGITVHDSSGNGNDGTLYGIALPTWVGGKWGKALQFDGIDDNVIVATLDGYMNGKSSGSICTWLNFSVPQANSAIAGWWGGHNFNIHVDISGRNISFHYCTTGALDNVITSPSAYNDTQWHFAVGTYDTVLGGILYIDAIPVATLPANGTLIEDSTFALGSYAYSVSGTFGNYFNGKIDEVRVYNRAISQAEVTALLNTNMDAYTLLIDVLFKQLAVTPSYGLDVILQNEPI